MRKIASLLLLLAVSHMVVASSLSDKGLTEAEHAMRAGDYAEAYCILRPLAEAGDAEAQFNVGWMYQNGYGLAINNSLALEWWRRASEQDHIEASFAIAMLYNHGEGEVERDSEKALDYFLLAAESGHEDAILILRSMLIRNDKAIQDRKAALIDEHAHLLGPLMQVRVKKVNVRQSPALDAGIRSQLVQGATVIELNQKDGWSQVAIVGEGDIAWIYSSLLEPKPVVTPEQMTDAEAGSEMFEVQRETEHAVGSDEVDEGF